MVTALTHAAYFSAVYLLVSVIPPGFLGEIKAASSALLVVGFLGIWRYSWAMTNFARAIWFRVVAHPRAKARAFARFRESGVKSHCYVMVTTYMVDVETTQMVYRRLFEALARAKDGATVVASVVDGKDVRLIKTMFEMCPHDLSHVELVIDRIKSSGKRDAMEKALRLLARRAPSEHDIMVFLDGDTAVPLDLWEQAAPWFSDPKVGALTTDEAALIDEEGLFKDWFTLRFHQRQVMMCSMGLARHVLTLTGRMSVFRASLATNPGFINGVGQDYLDHWRLGRVKFLTGDDKSTWYWLLKNGYEMLYLPDVQSQSVETQPRPGFYDSAKTLMVRWFGNMVRTNGRALRLPARDIGLFTKWSILDQRVSMWTTLVGPLSVFLTALIYTPVVIPLYIAWVMITRYTFCTIIALFNGTWFPVTHPFILYFGQVVGAVIKTFVFFRLDRQKWTRQGSGGSGPALALYDRIKTYESSGYHVLAVSWLIVAILFLNTIE
ncbi:glycosyltransferase [Cognatishimia sp. F0-27]|uniref:glycosyltransferase n=1 Tax=Cognatishimia sp. F0-27 TaxID=2816855 RepID=UPI001D0C57ED|nr:glycosyltransferase [Cognatishimia sp. F0-27]MCC1494899.1 glycosyltransferase [Cognatishimia sp. F0-27]